VWLLQTTWSGCVIQHLHVSLAQVFYHLGELDSALTYALGAGTHFNVDEQSEYVQTLIGESLQLCSTPSCWMLERQ
jgi:hypothetical protein